MLYDQRDFWPNKCERHRVQWKKQVSFLQDFSEELSAFSSFLASSLLGFCPHHFTEQILPRSLITLPLFSPMAGSQSWSHLIRQQPLTPPSTPSFDSPLPGFLPCGSGPSLPVPSCLFPLYLVLMVPLLESKLWAWFWDPHFLYFTDVLIQFCGFVSSDTCFCSLIICSFLCNNTCQIFSCCPAGSWGCVFIIFIW